MTVFKCKMCGGTIEFEQGATVGVCDSCGTKQTLPRIDDERRANLYDRANHFRRNNDFDKAADIYEQILNEDSADAEAYWSLVLCRYGIEYVEDPKTHKRIPTVNRAQFTSIYMDEDYKSALQYADGYQRQIYEEEAKVIDDIQKGILEISSKEEPFDVFICYKETDANGRRTQDSVLANDLYHELTEEGFKVFFSRITLEDKLGTAYEPYIFAALNSAKIMVVLGTKPEYFNAVWVKNEWSRYLSLVKKSNGKKMLIPAYRDMDPYDLPEEFSHLQAQDMSKLGFMQDLIRGIKKIISATAPKQTVKETVVVNNAASANISPLLERAFLFLEDGKWQDGNIYCEKVLDINPKSAEAYLGKLMVELRVKTRKQLADCEQPFDGSENYAKVIRFGDEKLENEMRGYIAHINERNENVRLAYIYNGAVNKMESAMTEIAFKAVSDTFKSISGFKDADMFAEQCLEKAEVCRKDAIYVSGKNYMTKANIDGYSKAIETFISISGWSDVDEQINACKKKIEDLKAKAEVDRLEQARKAEERRVAEEKVAKIRKKFIAIALPIICVCFAFIIFLTAVIIPNNKYNAAMKLYNDGKYSEAITAFEALGDYKDSKTQIDKCNTVIMDSKYNMQKSGLKNVSVGQIIKFGMYEQDNNEANGWEEITWQVLFAVEGNRALIISEKALDCQSYNSSQTNVTWETCSLRKWLNETFINSAFGPSGTEYQKHIQTTTVLADKNPYYSTNAGNATFDKIFLLSITEVEKYFSSDEARKCAPTAYAKANGAWTSSSYTKGDEFTCWWWLRSPGENQYRAAYVNGDGALYSGCYVNNDYGCVRPALWISLDF